jgi:Fe-S oxidoreductase
VRSWYRKHQSVQALQQFEKRVYLFCDEFTNYNDAHIGIKTIQLLNALGYEVIIPYHEESGRTWLSKGLVRKAQQIVNRNIELLQDIVTEETPIIGIEPSAILSFRDEYPELASDGNLEAAKRLAKHSFMVDEFIAREFEIGNIKREQFKSTSRSILLHGHCQQKAVGNLAATVSMLSLPEGHVVETIPSGCCGMAGSFGYEKEHYEVSMQIGELVLLPLPAPVAGIRSRMERERKPFIRLKCFGRLFNKSLFIQLIAYL